MPTGTTIPPSPTTSGSASRRCFPQFPHIELAARLEPCDQEEERHEPGVDPFVQISRQAGRAQSHRQVGSPGSRVAGCVRVSPHQGHERGGQQDSRATGLGSKEPAQRRLAAPHPGSPDREPRRQMTRLAHRALARPARLMMSAGKHRGRRNVTAHAPGTQNPPTQATSRRPGFPAQLFSHSRRPSPAVAEAIASPAGIVPDGRRSPCWTVRDFNRPHLSAASAPGCRIILLAANTRRGHLPQPWPRAPSAA